MFYKLAFERSKGNIRFGKVSFRVRKLLLAKLLVWRVLDNEWAVWRWTSSVLVVLDLLENSRRNGQFRCYVACMVFTMEPSTTSILFTSRLRTEYSGSDTVTPLDLQHASIEEN